MTTLSVSGYTTPKGVKRGLKDCMEIRHYLNKKPETLFLGY